MNKAIADYALYGLTAPEFPKKNGLCQKEARMAVQGALGHKYDDVLVKPSAREAAQSLLHAGFAFPVSELAKHGGLQLGDLLYKTEGSGGFGHVGIYTLRGVAENSTYHWKKTGGQDARGIRTLAQFGDFQLVARFPSPAQEKFVSVPVSHPVAPKPQTSLLYLNGRVVQGAVIHNGHFEARVVDVLEALGLNRAMDQTKTTATEHHIRVWAK
ncbi:hypothetical protein IAD21_00908 [Abditibacteriota bacterium]|nr:hypothetical protein IAD21_00908 [Abditibacteriota bacterium]